MISLSEIKEHIFGKTLALAKRAGDNTPISTDGKKYRFGGSGDWRLGFWPGILNYCYLMSNDKKYLDYAEVQRPKLIDRLYNHPETLDHDIGFLYAPTEFARYKITGSEESLKVCKDAADKLCERFNPKGKYIVAWPIWPFEQDFSKDNDRRIIIDCMFNLPLLFEMSKITGDTKYYDVANGHAESCMQTIVRPDGTTYHTYLFDRETGKPDRGQTWQGYSDSSCWSRGQAWAVGGFTMAYRYTGDRRYLDTAMKVSDKFVELLDDNFLPAWDFEFRGQGAVPDASAAAIAACGMLELATYCEGDKSAFYKESAEKLIEALWNNCSTKDDDDFEAIITGCTGFFRMNSEINTGIIYGDYYFVKAIAKLCGTEWFI